MNLLVDDPAETNDRIANLAKIAGIACDDPAVLAEKVRTASGIINLSTIPDASLADRLRAVSAAPSPQVTFPYPNINQNVADPAVRLALGSLDLAAIPADRRMAVLAQVTRTVNAKREANVTTAPAHNPDAAALAGLHGEAKLAAYRRREAGRKALVEHQNLMARLSTIRDPMAKATARDTLARYAAQAQAAGFAVA